MGKLIQMWMFHFVIIYLKNMLHLGCLVQGEQEAAMGYGRRTWVEADKLGIKFQPIHSLSKY